MREEKTMKTLIKNFVNDESGASAAEYALILAVVGVAIGGASLLLADTIGDSIGTAAGRVDACADAAGSTTGDTACPQRATTGTGVD